MKYKLLLVGRNESLITDFFMHQSAYYECLSCSSRFDDIVNHLKYFQPDTLLYCMHNEVPDTMTVIASVKRDKTRGSLPVAIVGTLEETQTFQTRALNTADLVLHKPITSREVGEKIEKMLKELRMTGMAPAPSPVMEAPAQQEDQATLYNELENMFQSRAAVNARRHVLVVDDDSRMLKTIKRDLEEQYDVATAINGKVALKFLENRKTDLILLDYEMPLENGPEVLEKLRANPATAEIPVIFLTGVNDKNKILNALSMKPQGYIIKPVDRIKLLETIKNTIG